MGGEVERYAFEDGEGIEQTFTTFDPTEARETAQRNGWRVIAHTFEWADSEVVWDYTSKPVTGFGADEDPYMEGPNRRPGTVHEESVIGGRSHCGRCGYVDEGRPDPYYHPEFYASTIQQEAEG